MMPRKELQYIDEALGLGTLPAEARNWLERRKDHVDAVVKSIPSNKRQQNG